MDSGGEGYKEIATDPNKLDRKTKAANSFSKNSIYDILRNEKYKGVLVHSEYRKEFGGKRKRHNVRGDESTLYLPNLIPAIVDLETWTKANDKLDQRAGWGRGHAKHEDLLSGLIYCGECESPMEGNRARGDYFYRCTGKKRDAASCSSSKVSAELVESEVIKLLRTDLLNKRSIRTLLPKIVKAATERATESAVDALALRERIDEIDKQSERLIEAIMEMDGSSSIRTKLKELEDEKA